MKKRVIIVGLAIVFVVSIAIAVYPFLPFVKYYFFPKPTEIPGIPEESIASLPIAENNQEVGGNVLIISKIGVRIPILEGEDESVLNLGAWHLSESSTPDQGGNTAIAGHRWKYRPPSEKTFYLLDKLEIGDTFQIFWQDKEYDYKIVSSFVVLPTDVWVLNKTEKPTVTLITCTPLFSTSKRLVVKGELVIGQ